MMSTPKPLHDNSADRSTKDLAYVIFIDFLALGVLGFCFCC